MKPGAASVLLPSNPYLQSLQGLRPGQMIDDLKEQATQKRKHNEAIITAINQLTDEVNKTKEKRNEQLRKTDRARRDKLELYRDLSTYEYNFVRRNDFGLMAKLDKIT